jgi:RNA polymerase primary sigma factor
MAAKRSLRLAGAIEVNRRPSAFATYGAQIRRCRFLSRDEEAELAARAKSGDREARDRLIESLLPYVVRLAARFCERYRYPLEDAIQAGNIGLIRAVDLTRPKRLRGSLNRCDALAR